ncbi:MAG: tetratricopeptide repeat protein [Nitrospiraceae bacterium]
MTAAAGLALFGMAAGGLQENPAVASEAVSIHIDLVAPEPSAPVDHQTESFPEPEQGSLRPQTSPESSGTQPTDTAPAEAEPASGLLPAASGDLIGTIVQLRDALRLRPDSVTARLDLGSALYQIGDIDSAIEIYREAVRREPDLVEARMQLATALMAKHE